MAVAIHKLCERKTDHHDKIDRAISHLEMCGDIELVERHGRGRPTSKWRWIG